MPYDLAHVFMLLFPFLVDSLPFHIRAGLAPAILPPIRSLADPPPSAPLHPRTLIDVAIYTPYTHTHTISLFMLSSIGSSDPLASYLVLSCLNSCVSA